MMMKKKELKMFDLNLVRNIFNVGISSSIGNIEIAIQFCDYLKKHTLVGFLSKRSAYAVYEFIYRTKEQDEKIDFIYSMYNSLYEHNIIDKIDAIVDNYTTFIEDNGLEESIKDMYGQKEKHDTIDRIMFTLYFIRLYLEVFESVVIVNVNKRNKKDI